MSELLIPFSLKNPWAFPLHGLPLRCSIPLPQGVVKNPAKELALVDEKGRDCSAQWRVLSTWNDGSARFALMDYAEAEMPPRSAQKYTLQRRGGKMAASRRTTIKVTETAEALRGIRITNAAVNIRTSKPHKNTVIHQRNCYTCHKNL